MHSNVLKTKVCHSTTLFMNHEEQVNAYLLSLSEPKRSDMQALHHLMLEVMPESELWFMDGKNSANKIVSNPNIGYGFQLLNYADGSSKPFYQIGISATKTGISVYILTFKDRTYLAKTYGKNIGKATVTSYCIQFKKLNDINIALFKEMLQDGIGTESKDLLR